MAEETKKVAEAKDAEEPKKVMFGGVDIDALLKEQEAKDDTVIANKIVADGNGKIFNNLKIINCNITCMSAVNEQLIPVYSFTVDRPVLDTEKQEDGTYRIVARKVINNISAINVGYALKKDDITALYAEKAMKEPEVFKKLVIGAKLDIVQEYVIQGQDYINPFGNTEKISDVKHDDLYNTVLNIKFDPETIGTMKAERLNLFKLV